MTRVLALLLLLTLGREAQAFPTSLNLMPTADMLQPGSLRMELENDGAPSLFASGAESYLLLQYAPSSRLEVGLDLYAVGESNRPLLNAKWLLLAEEKRRPALALGLMELGPGCSPTGYLVGTKELGPRFRGHLGAGLCDGRSALLWGGEWQLSENDYLVMDWTTWSSGYLSLGLYHEAQPGLGLNLAWAWPNDRSESGLLILNVSRSLPLRRLAAIDSSGR
jgi:hypothetical protein